MYFEEALNELLASGKDGMVVDRQKNCWIVKNGQVLSGSQCRNSVEDDWTAILDKQDTPVPPQEPEPEPEHEQEPELLTGWEAIKLALKNGGEIWNETIGSFRIRIENKEVTKYNAGVSLGEKYYAVRPLTFDFDEAKKRMDSGERVKDEDGNEYSVALVKNTFGGSCQFVAEKDLVDKRFTSVPK